MLFLSRGGVRAPDPKLFVRNAAPFCFFAATRETEVNYSLDVKKRLLVKKKKKTKGCNFINGRTTTVLSTWDTMFYSVSKIFQENEEFLLYRRGMKHPLRKRVTTFVPASHNETRSLKGNFVTLGRNKFLLKTRTK